uniref:Uncharacterized protein n=1 Tax=Setaria italica TaxID=4555 RepID=K4A4H5_SETIT
MHLAVLFIFLLNACSWDAAVKAFQWSTRYNLVILLVQSSCHFGGLFYIFTYNSISLWYLD